MCRRQCLHRSAIADALVVVQIRSPISQRLLISLVPHRNLLTIDSLSSPSIPNAVHSLFKPAAPGAFNVLSVAAFRNSSIAWHILLVIPTLVCNKTYARRRILKDGMLKDKIVQMERKPNASTVVSVCRATTAIGVSFLLDTFVKRFERRNRSKLASTLIQHPILNKNS